MLNNATSFDRIYIACGYTDLRRGIDGLAALAQQQFNLDPFTNTLFLFCGRRRDRIKASYWEGNGFVLLYKRLESGSFQWPRKESEARAEYQQIIRDTFAAKGKELREDLDMPYYYRGSHRQHLIEQGLPYAFDRTAVMMVSLESHFRSGVMVQNYLAK